MALRTADEYRSSLQDGRVLWYRGKRVDDVLGEPDLRVAVDHSALDFEIGHDPEHRDVAVVDDPEVGEIQRVLPDPASTPTTSSPA